ncbi:MAG TPA: DUF1614 domain-containing protein [Gaiellaceae bacterium]|nr:DUF1614 domain-containing protein [Gaiellaceae bacterium]
MRQPRKPYRRGSTLALSGSAVAASGASIEGVGDSPRASWVLVFALALLLLFLWLLVLMDVVSFAYQRLGLSPEQALLLLLASLAGSQINLPVARVKSEQTVAPRVVTAFGVSYVIPGRFGGTTLIAVNVGGALIPTGFSIWMLVRTALWWQAAVATLVVAVFVHLVARTVPGVGIAVPSLVPPLIAAAAAVAIAGTHHAAVVAYVAGTLGTLIGADLTNLRRIPETGSPVASIGGAGTFDAVFLSGVVAVLLATIL